MKLELDSWYELWDRAGSQGLDTWHEPAERTGEPEDLPAGGGPSVGPAPAARPDP